MDILYSLQFHLDYNYCHIRAEVCEGGGEYKWWMITLYYNAEKQPVISPLTVGLYLQSENEKNISMKRKQIVNHILKSFCGNSCNDKLAKPIKIANLQFFTVNHP